MIPVEEHELVGVELGLRDRSSYIDSSIKTIEPRHCCVLLLGSKLVGSS